MEDSRTGGTNSEIPSGIGDAKLSRDWMQERFEISRGLRHVFDSR